MLAASLTLSSRQECCNYLPAIKGQCSEHEALDWHSKRVAEGYPRFLLIVLSVLKQIREQGNFIISDWDQAGFERAFTHFRPSEYSGES